MLKEKILPFSLFGKKAKLVVKEAELLLGIELTCSSLVSLYYALCLDVRHFIRFLWPHTRSKLF